MQKANKNINLTKVESQQRYIQQSYRKFDGYPQDVRVNNTSVPGVLDTTHQVSNKYVSLSTKEFKKRPKTKRFKQISHQGRSRTLCVGYTTSI
jgi:hypothetical protein